MKRKTASFTGMRPIFTGSPSIVQGGFNLDVENQHFAVGDTVPAGTLAIKDEVKRTVQVIKTAKVVEVDAENTKKVSLYVDEFYEPCFAVGDLVLKDGTAATAIADVPTIEKIEAQRIAERTNFDIEMMQETGFCSGIENYSRHLAGLP